MAENSLKRVLKGCLGGSISPFGRFSRIRDEVFDGHVASGEGASFVETDGVDVDEDLFAAEANSGEGKDARGEQDEALGDHVDEGGDGAGDSDFSGGSGKKGLGVSEKGGNGEKTVAARLRGELTPE